MKAFRSIALVLVTAAISISATFLLAPKRASASTILKSKSNISNNRMASQIGKSPAGPWDAIVLCESCAYPPMPEEGCLILMDNQTGEIYAYCDDAMTGKAKPRHIGKLTAVGEPIVPAAETK